MSELKLGKKQLLGSLLPFVAQAVPDEREQAALNAYRIEYAAYRQGASRGARGEVNRLMDLQEMQVEYFKVWQLAGQAQEAEDAIQDAMENTRRILNPTEAPPGLAPAEAAATASPAAAPAGRPAAAPG